MPCPTPPRPHPWVPQWAPCSRSNIWPNTFPNLPRISTWPNLSPDLLRAAHLEAQEGQPRARSL